jgi:serine/threonine protein kinase
MSAPLTDSLEDILDRFDDAWNGPTPPRIEDFAPPSDSPTHLPVLIELVKIDLERRCRCGEPPALDDYRQRFPACADAGWLNEARAAAERAASARKDTDDPGSFPTLAGPPIPPPLLDVPARLLGEYELLGLLGEGGMGEVYKARHRRLDKLVALKLLPAGSQHRQELAARFQREMKAVGALDHPNVVEAHDAGEQSGVVYLAMKLVDGVDLERLVKQGGPLPIAEACELVRQAALGLHYLHERGLVHRDVKPSNLMRTTGGTVKVLDLGLARWRVEAEAGNGLTGTGRVMGTPDFLAPEQIEDAANADARADVYGLGGTLFYLLIGRAPFADHKSLYSKLDAHRHEPPPDVRTLRPETPAELAALVHRMLAKKPDERPATAAEVAAALTPFADGSAGSVPLTLLTQNSVRESPPSGHGAAAKSETTIPERQPASGERKRASRQRHWMLALSLLLLAGAAVLGAMMMRPSHPVSKKSTDDGPSSSRPPEPLRITSLTVKLTPAGEGKPVGALGEDVFATRAGDTVTVQARLTQPAYAFLIAYRPDGKTELCFPESANEPPVKTDRPRYPLPPKGDEYGLSDGTGLAAFALVVSSEPLPSFEEWWSRQQGCPWKKEGALFGLVYRANGEDEVEVLDADGSRGKGAEVKGKTPMARLAEWLRKRPGIKTVQVLGFGVEAKE